jgi:hypothetical protein
MEMKQHGLAWRPQVGCFVWDPDEHIKPDLPFPGRIYFILSLKRFIEIFESIEQMLLFCHAGLDPASICRKRPNSTGFRIKYGMTVRKLGICMP